MAGTTWILTSSPENHAATEKRGFSVIGLKERNLARARQVKPDDRFVLYLTREMTFAGSIIIVGEMFEDRTPVWPGKPPNPDIYPWRFDTEAEVVPAPGNRVPAEVLRRDLNHVRKWPPEHWRLAFQGQIRAVDDEDTETLLGALKAADG